MHKALCSVEEVPYYLSGHPSNFKVTHAEKSIIESNVSKIIRPVAAIKSLRFAFLWISRVSWQKGPICHA